MSGVGGMLSVLEGLRAAISDPAPTFRRVVHPWALDHFQRQFDTAGGHGGSPWAPLSGRYLEQQRELGDSTVPLEADRPVLEPSFTREGDPNHIFEINGNQVRVGSSLSYAAHVAEGGVDPFGENFPGRDPRQMTQQQTEALSRSVMDDMTNRARGSVR